MNDTDKALYFIVSVNDKDKSVLIQDLMFGDKFYIKNREDFYVFAKNQLQLEEEEDTPLYFNVEFDENNQVIDYGK